MFTLTHILGLLWATTTALATKHTQVILFITSYLHVAFQQANHQRSSHILTNSFTIQMSILAFQSLRSALHKSTLSHHKDVRCRSTLSIKQQ